MFLFPSPEHQSSEQLQETADRVLGVPAHPVAPEHIPQANDPKNENPENTINDPKAATDPDANKVATNPTVPLTDLYGLPMDNDVLINGIKSRFIPPSKENYRLDDMNKLYYAQDQQDILMAKLFKNKVSCITY